MTEDEPTTNRRKQYTQCNNYYNENVFVSNIIVYA